MPNSLVATAPLLSKPENHNTFSAFRFVSIRSFSYIITIITIIIVVSALLLLVRDSLVCVCLAKQGSINNEMSAGRRRFSNRAPELPSQPVWPQANALRSTFSYQPPTFSNQLPATRYPRPATSYQLPDACCLLHIHHKRAPPAAPNALLAGQPIGKSKPARSNVRIALLALQIADGANCARAASSASCKSWYS